MSNLNFSCKTDRGQKRSNTPSPGHWMGKLDERSSRKKTDSVLGKGNSKERRREEHASLQQQDAMRKPQKCLDTTIQGAPGLEESPKLRGHISSATTTLWRGPLIVSSCRPPVMNQKSDTLPDPKQCCVTGAAPRSTTQVTHKLPDTGRCSWLPERLGQVQKAEPTAALGWEREMTKLSPVHPFEKHKGGEGLEECAG